MFDGEGTAKQAVAQLMKTMIVRDLPLPQMMMAANAFAR
jgi:hypothetical protein